MEEYVSWEAANKIFDNRDKLNTYYHLKLHRSPTKFWYYPVNGSGGHHSSPRLEDSKDIFYLVDDDEFYGAIIHSFNWKELYELMNVCVDGDYRKTEFESIEDIDQFAIELNQYLKEKGDIEIQDFFR